MAGNLLTMNGSADLAGAMAKQIAADVAREETRIARAHQSAAKEVADKFKGELRADLAGLSPKLQNTWRGRVYGNDGLSPAIYLWNSAPLIVDAFSLGVPIQAGSGKFLAIPVGRARTILKTLNRTENRSRSGGRFVSEGKTVDRVAAALGVTLGFRPPRGGKAGELFARGLGNRKDELLFVLVKQVHLPVLVKGRAALPSLSARVAAEFAAALERYA